MGPPDDAGRYRLPSITKIVGRRSVPRSSHIYLNPVTYAVNIFLRLSLLRLPT